MVIYCVSTVDPEQYNLLRQQLGELLVKFLGIALAPREILFVRDIPRTQNAKVLRQVIRSVYMDQDPGDFSNLINPDAIEEIRNAK